MVLPQPDGTLYVGLTDEPVTGPVPDVPDAERGRDRLPPRRRRLGVHHARRPATTSSAPSPVCGRCSRSRAPMRRPTCPAGTRSSPPPPGVTTVVGGKLTTYRRMAAGHPRRAGRRRTPGRGSVPDGGALPLLGAASAGRPAPHAAAAPARTTLRHRRRPRAGHRPRGHRPGRRRAARPGVGGRPGDARRAGLRASPTRARTTSTTCSTGVPASGSSPPTARPREPLARRALALASQPTAGR